MNCSIAMYVDRNVVTSRECRQFAGKIAGMAQILRVGSRGIALGEVGGAEGQTPTGVPCEVPVSPSRHVPVHRNFGICV